MQTAYLRYYVYFLLFFCFVVFLVSSQILPDKGYYPGLIYIYTLLLLPFFDRLLQVFHGEKVFLEDIYIVGRNPTYYTILLGVVLIALYMQQSFVAIVFLFSTLFGIFFGLNPKIPFLGALLLLFYVPFFLFMGKQGIAESLSIFVYYFLVIGVFFEIRSIVYPKISFLGK